MKRLSEVLRALGGPGADHAGLLAAYLASEPAATRLLCGTPPPRLIPIATLRDWVAGETGLPDWMIDACRSATGDLTEALALMLPAPHNADVPALSAVLADLTSLPPGPLARPAILSMARRLPPQERVLYFRLITGTFRAPRPPVLADKTAPTHDILAVMIYAEAALPTGASGPELTLAVWQGADLVPLTRARATLPAAQTTDLLTWIRKNATGRFGPLRAVPATQVFALRFSIPTANRRRKSGLSLTNPEIIGWHPDCDPSHAAHLDTLTALLPAKA